MSRSKVDKSSKWGLIKVILTKNQRRSKENKDKVRVKMNRNIKLNRTCYYIEKFNIVFSLCGALGVNLYFSKSCSETVAKTPQSLKLTVVCFLKQKSNL